MPPPSVLHLPNGTNLTVTHVFGGLFFKANLDNHSSSVFPPGWTIVLNSEDDASDHPDHQPLSHRHSGNLGPSPHPPHYNAHHDHQDRERENTHHIHRFNRPTLRNDHLYISSISNPSSSEFKPSASPTRQIAMMLWATLWWYFHQPAPSPHHPATPASSSTPPEGRPKGDWRVNINREGILKGRHLLQKLERMGLISSEDSSVGLDMDDTDTASWTSMFVSQRSFWQLDARIYLFTLTPNTLNPGGTPYPSLSPSTSRPASPSRASLDEARPTQQRSSTPPIGGPIGAFTSTSHLPTFYPPPPLQYTFTNSIRHPIRPKPPRQGETFYTRYIPSLGQYLSFRVASLSPRPVVHRGAKSNAPRDAALRAMASALGPLGIGFPSSSAAANKHHSDPAVPTIGSALRGATAAEEDECETLGMCDTELLHKWMNDPRVAHSWGEEGPISHQKRFLEHCLTSRHSFPVIGCFDGKPFGFFEIYWVKEDKLSAHLNLGGSGDWDRGLHVLVGEQEFRGEHRVGVWLSALVHYCWLGDARTGRVVMEPRVDNAK